ncbi:hypothetical protein [Kitasatospora sp. NPDC059599]|uniref:hypothetical protein n=1 Tax=Kitasatospora sp. NPDC059599 TaxID=3346880 RepID=UPI0036917A51
MTVSGGRTSRTPGSGSTPNTARRVRTGLSDPGQPVQIVRYRFSGRNDPRETIIHEELHHGWFERPQTYVRKHHPKPSEARNAAHLAQTDRFHEIVQRYMNIRGWNGSGKRK